MLMTRALLFVSVSMSYLHQKVSSVCVSQDFDNACAAGCYWSGRTNKDCGKDCIAAECTEVGKGYWSGEADLQRYACPPGECSNTTEGASCRRCDPGTFQPRGASAVCELCPAGQYSEGPAALECNYCPPGSFNQYVGQDSSMSCLHCTPGYDGPGAKGAWVNERNETICLLDPDEEFPNSPMTTPFTPPSIFSVSGPSSQSSIGPYVLNSPPSAFSKHPSPDLTFLLPYPIQQPLEVLTNFPTQMLSSAPFSNPAQTTSTLPSGSHDQVQTISHAAGYELELKEKRLCPIGHAGKNCAECCSPSHLSVTIANEDELQNSSCLASDELLDSENYVFQRYFRQDGRCEKCPTTLWSVLLGVFALIALVLIWWTNATTRVEILVYIHIGLDFLQTLAFIGSVGVNWPGILSKTWRVASLANYEVNSIWPPECFFDISYQEKAAALLALPPTLFISMIVLCIVVIPARAMSASSNSVTEYAKNRANAAIGLGTAFVYFGYLKLSMTAAEGLGCIYWHENNDWLCYTNNRSNQLVILVGTVALAAYTIGFPLLVSALLFTVSSRAVINQDQHLLQEQYRQNVGGAESCHASVRQRYGCFYKVYQPKFWYWSLIVMVRRFALAMIYSVFHTQTVIRLSSSAGIVVLFGALHFACNPLLFLSKSADLTRAGELKEDDDDCGKKRQLREVLYNPNVLHLVLNATCVAAAFSGIVFHMNVTGEKVEKVVSYATLGMVLGSLTLTMLAMRMAFTAKVHSSRKIKTRTATSDSLVVNNKENGSTCLRRQKALVERKKSSMSSLEIFGLLYDPFDGEPEFSLSDAEFEVVSDAAYVEDVFRGPMVPSLSFSPFRIEETV